MARFNLYDQQTSAQTPKASGAAFGADVGAAVQQGGDAMAQLGYRIQRREELAASDALRQELDTWAVPALDDFSKRHDINSPQAIQEFQGTLQQKKQELLNKFGGSSESKASLDRELGNQIYQYGKSAITTKIKAGHEVLARTVNTIIETGVNNVMANPLVVDDVIAQNQFEVIHRKDGMDAAMFQNAMKVAIAAPMEAAVRAHLANGSLEQAEAIMKDPRFNEYVGSDQARPLRIQVAVDRGVIVKEQRDLERNAAQWSSVLPKGTVLTPEQIKSLPKFSSIGGAERIAAHKLITGVEPTDQEKQRYLGLDRAEKESMIGEITDNVMVWDSLDPNQRLRTVLMIKKAYPDINAEDKFGNRVRQSTVPAELERFVSGSGTGSGAGAVGGPSDAQPSRGGMTVPAGVQNERDREAQFIKQSELNSAQQRLEVAQASGDTTGITRAQGDIEALTREMGQGSAPAATQAQEKADGLVNLYDNADKMVGAESWIKRNAAKLPFGVGDKLKVDPLYAEAAKASEILQNDVTEGLRHAGGRDANQYRQELKKIVSIDPALINSTRNYRVEMRTIDKELRTRLSNYQKVAETGATKEMRQDAAAAVSTITTIIGRLNIPQKVVNSREEVQKLPSGTRFLYRDDPTPQVRK